MAKLIPIKGRVLLPPGSMGGPVKLEYAAPYRVAAQLAGGRHDGWAVRVDGQWAEIHEGKTADTPYLSAYAPELGDPLSSLVTVTVTPEGPGVRALPIVIKGHPRDTGGGGWNLSAFGAVLGETLTTEAQRQSLETALAESTQQRARVAQAVAGAEQTSSEVRTLVGVRSLGREPHAGDPAATYRWAGPSGLVDIAWNGAAETGRTPAVPSAANTSVTAVAQITDPNNASADISAWLPRALALRSGEIPTSPTGVYRLTQRLTIDCQGQRFDLTIRGRLQFDVPDANGGPMIRLINPARGSLLNFGEIEVLWIPLPTRDITEGNEPESDVGEAFGPAFERVDLYPGVVRRYWRTHNDHAIEIVNGQDCVVTVQVKSARAMGVVLNGGKNMHLYGSVANTLADGTHMHNGPQNIHWWMDAENCGDDAFPVVPKPGEPLPRNIHYYGTAKGGFGRHFVFAGGEMVYWNGTQSTDAYKESYLCTEDTHYQTGVPGHLYATDIFSVNAGQRDTSQQGEAQPAAFRVGMVPGGNEHHIFLTRGSFTGARGAGMWLGGKLLTVTDTQSTGNGLPDHVYAADAVIQGRGSVYDQMVIHQSFATVKDVRFRKSNSSGAYALLLTGPGQVGTQITGNDFGTGWTYPLATDGALDSTCVVRDNMGLALGDLPAVGTAGIANTPALPGSGAGWITNNTPFDVLVMIHGGAVLSINIRSPNGATVDVGALRMFSLPRGWQVNPFWTATPERWVWAVSR